VTSRRIALRLLLSVAIAAGLSWWLLSQGFDVIPSARALGRTPAWWALPAYALLFSAFHVLRAWRWRFLIDPFAEVRTGTMMAAAFAGFLAIQMMPLRTGELARPWLLDRHTGISKSALLGTVAIERVVDGLLVSLALTAALLAIPADAGPYVWGLRIAPLAVFVCALVLLVAYFRRPEPVGRLVRSGLGLFSRRLSDFAGGVLERFHQGLASLPEPRSFWAFNGMSLAYWAVNAAALWLLARGCGLELSAAGSVAVMGCLAVGILLPAGPGYFGNFQLSVLVALGLYLDPGAHSEKVAVFIFLLYALQTGLTILFGAAAFLVLLRTPLARREESAGAQATK
jgi:uncharacterized protein (TIRG00374 family)